MAPPRKVKDQFNETKGKSGGCEGKFALGFPSTIFRA
jgi:hypothetical protein